MAGEDRYGKAECCNLSKREVHEDDTPRKDVKSEICVDAGEDEARDERPKQ
jgi:hypothetical protein